MELWVKLGRREKIHQCLMNTQPLNLPNNKQSSVINAGTDGFIAQSEKSVGHHVHGPPVNWMESGHKRRIEGWEQSKDNEEYMTCNSLICAAAAAAGGGGGVCKLLK